MKEEWRSVVGFEGLYEVSSLGRVKRVAPGKRTFVGRLLRPTRRKGKAYLYVGLRRDGGTFYRTVHSLVLTTFKGPCPPGLEARHLNGKGDNNHVENLVWGTQEENCADKVRHGTHSRGARSPRAKLSEEQAREILQSPSSYSTLMKKFSVSKATIADVKKGRRWQHLQEGAK